MSKKSIQELDLMDDFLFTEASADEQTAEILIRLIIERSSGMKVGRLIIESQKTVNGIDTETHGIRMDLSIKEVAEEDGQTIRLFDVEPNNIKTVHLPKRSRYYQALADVKMLDAGCDYDQMPDMMTIWILSYDPFGLDFMLYSVKNVVEDHEEIVYNDGVRKLFLYTKGKKGGTEALKNLLTYLQESIEENAVDEELQELHTSVSQLKNSRKVGVKYMNMQEVINYRVAEEAKELAAELAEQMAEQMAAELAEQMAEQMAEQKAREIVDRAIDDAVEKKAAEVETRMARLMQILLKLERYDDMGRVAVDEAYRKKLLEEYCNE